MNEQFNNSDINVKILEMINKNDEKNNEAHQKIMEALESIKTVTITEKNNTYSQSIEQAFININNKMTLMEEKLESIVVNMPQKAEAVINHWNTKMETVQKFAKSIMWILAVLIGLSVFVGLTKMDMTNYYRIFHAVESNSLTEPAK